MARDVALWTERGTDTHEIHRHIKSCQSERMAKWYSCIAKYYSGLPLALHMCIAKHAQKYVLTSLHLLFSSAPQDNPSVNCQPINMRIMLQLSTYCVHLRTNRHTLFIASPTSALFAIVLCGLHVYLSMCWWVGGWGHIRGFPGGIPTPSCNHTMQLVHLCMHPL